MIADINLTYSTITRGYLLREGLSLDMVIKIGSSVFEVLNYYRDSIEALKIASQLGLERGIFLLLALIVKKILIRINKSFLKLVEILNTGVAYYDFPVIVSTHPPKKKRVNADGRYIPNDVQLFKLMGFKNDDKLQYTARLILSDGGLI